MGWGDDQIAAWLGITAPSFLQVISFVTSWGPPPILAALTMWTYHWLHSRQARQVPQGGGSQHDGGTPLDKQAEDIARRIDVLGSKYPLTMPDHPEYPRIGVGRNEEANEAYMREYRETMATDVQRVFAEAIARGLMDDLDQIYSREAVVARRGVEEIGRILVRIGRNVRAGDRAPLPPAFQPKPDYPDTPLRQFVERRLQLDHPTDSDAAEDYVVAVGSLFTQIRDKAVLGQITVWGRENCAVGQKHTPLTPIPAEHWKIAQIDILDYLIYYTDRGLAELRYGMRVPA